ncbi:hypothetical protein CAUPRSCDRAFT_12170 [Caulochytrium protostelioides]|uniref:Uncharacterized protein n=1 Tax=Caulochytrium protostelioides TaxID=1555241 RepID=A0A4P9WXF9_9FUNG|nr:hypothetical protein CAUPRSCDRAFT_12170 [Caulochytrium protostelioides]
MEGFSASQCQTRHRLLCHRLPGVPSKRASKSQVPSSSLRSASPTGSTVAVASTTPADASLALVSTSASSAPVCDTSVTPTWNPADDQRLMDLAQQLSHYHRLWMMMTHYFPGFSSHFLRRRYLQVKYPLKITRMSNLSACHTEARWLEAMAAEDNDILRIQQNWFPQLSYSQIYAQVCRVRYEQSRAKALTPRPDTADAMSTSRSMPFPTHTFSLHVSDEHLIRQLHGMYEEYGLRYKTVLLHNRLPTQAAVQLRIHFHKLSALLCRDPLPPAVIAQALVVTKAYERNWLLVEDLFLYPLPLLRRTLRKYECGEESVDALPVLTDAEKTELLARAARRRTIMLRPVPPDYVPPVSSIGCITPRASRTTKTSSHRHTNTDQ